MKTKLLCFATMIAGLMLATAQAQTTAFTFQGRLNDANGAANGTYDMTFTAWTAASAGSQVAGQITNSAVAVGNGLFTVSLNFGSGIFTGTNYWVEMGVRTNGGSSFATLAPRQQLTPAPAAFSLSAVSPQATALCPAGAVMAFAGASAPAGWLVCDGSAVSRTTYSSLFATIGTTYGTGDGSTTFNLPDMRGRTGIGAGTGSGLTARALGQTPGEEKHTLTATEMPVHNHGVNDPGHSHLPLTGGGFYTWGAGVANVGSGSYGYGISQPGTAPATTGITIQNAGGSGGVTVAHNVMQPSLVLNYIIKY